MQSADSRATLVICATVPAAGDGRSGEWTRAVQPGVPLTWIAPWDRLGAISAGGSVERGVALDLPAGVLESRQRLRTLLARGREAWPGLDTVFLTEVADRDHRRMLVDEGIRAVLVDRLSVERRGARRPAPRGWRCHNTAWGLWDIEVAARRPRGPLAWLGRGMPRLRPGMLHVVQANAAADGSTGGRGSQGRLDRWLAWAGRHVEQGTLRVLTINGLLARLTGDEPSIVTGSVLRAA